MKMKQLVRVLRPLVARFPMERAKWRSYSGISASTGNSGSVGHSAITSASGNCPVDEDDVEKFTCSLDSETRQRLEKYMAEYEIFKYADARMPSRMTVKHWRRMLLMDSKHERIQYLSYVYEVEREIAKEAAKKMENRARAEETAEKARAEIKRQAEEHIYYGLGGNCMFRRILDPDINRQMNARLAMAMHMGPHIIFDMTFYPIMRPVERSLTTKQLQLVYRENRLHRFPHHIIFSGCRRDDPSWEDVERYFVGGLDALMATFTDQHYLDMFPRDRLVYLSPDAKLAVQEYDPDKVYVVAALVDRVARPNLTLGRAKEEGIEARRLPLERCVRLLSTKSLCLNHVISVMNDALADGSMITAILKNMPKKKVVQKHDDCSKHKRELLKQRLDYLRSLGDSD